MIDEFLSLRVIARSRRDAAIEEAHREYGVALQQIAALQQRLINKPKGMKPAPVSASVDAVLPQDRPFGVSDIMLALESYDPRRVWLVQSVNKYIAELRQRGIIERVIRAKMGIPAVYCVRGVKHDIKPGDDLTLVEAIEQVVTGPMTISEIVVAVLEAGHKTRMPPGMFRTVVLKTLADRRYRRSGGKWTAEQVC